MTEWIKCSERLPEACHNKILFSEYEKQTYSQDEIKKEGQFKFSDDVIVYTKDRNYFVGWYNYKEDRWEGFHSEYDDFIIEYWMPLPELPEEI